MKQYSELSVVIHTVLVHKLRPKARQNKANPNCLPDHRALLWVKVLDKHFEVLKFWALGRYSHLLAPDQLLLLFYDFLERTLTHQGVKIYSQNISLERLANHLEVLLDHHFQLSR